MGTVNRKRKFEILSETGSTKMPRYSFPRRKRSYRKYSRYSTRTNVPPTPRYLAVKPQRGPVQDVSFIGNSSLWTVVGPTNTFAEYRLDLSTILSNSQGHIVLRDAFTLFKPLSITIKIQVSEHSNIGNNYVVSYQYAPNGIYPALSESDNQHENCNSITKTVDTDTPAYFKGRWNMLSEAFGTTLLSAYVPQTAGWSSTGGASAGTMAGIQAGRLIISNPSINFSTQPTNMRFTITIRNQYACPRFIA